MTSKMIVLTYGSSSMEFAKFSRLARVKILTSGGKTERRSVCLSFKRSGCALPLKCIMYRNQKPNDCTMYPT